MRLTVFNGSPRGRRGNTAALLEHFLKGFTETPGNAFELTCLLGAKDPGKNIESFAGAETVLVAFPLYVDSMPAMVKDFIEALEPLCGRENNPALAFLIQSGFPEAAHLRALERYLEKLCRRLGCRYLGTIVKGGGEGIRFMPESRVQKIFQGFYGLGRSFGADGVLDRKKLEQLSAPEHLSRSAIFILKILQALGILDTYWNRQLKENKAYEKRFDAPYGRARA